MTTAIVTINKQGIIQSVDNGCCTLFGYEMNELPGQPVTILIPTPYKEQHDSYLRNYENSRKPKIIGRSRTVEGLHKDGTIFTIRLSVSEISIGPGCIYVGMIERIEETTAIITTDNQGNVISCNNNCKQLWGYDCSEISGQNVRMLMPSPHREAHDSYIQTYHETGKMRVIGRVRNVPAQHKNGIVFPVCLQVQRVKINGAEIFRAKIDRVEVERELVFTLDKDGTILSCNRIFVLTLMGYTAEELLGKHLNFLIPNLFRTIQNSSISRNKLGKRERKLNSPESPTPKKPSSKFCGLKQNSFPPVSESLDASANGGSCPDVGSSNSSSEQLLLSSEETPMGVFSHQVSSPVDLNSLEAWSTSGKQLAKCRHKDGSTFTVSVTITKFTNNEQAFFAGKMRRISEVSNCILTEEGESGAISEIVIGDGKYSIGGKSLGSGTYGKVKIGKNLQTGETVAVKILQKDIMDDSELIRSRREIEILKNLRHPNICCLYDSFESKDRLYLIMELAGGGELFSYITERGKLSEEEARYFFKQILGAVDFCHSSNVIHRDIKHKNILLDKNFNVKLIDFGLSNFTVEGVLRSTFCGTPAYSAPEMILAEKYYGPEVDIWSLGVVLYSMLTGQFPFRTVSDIIKGNFPPAAGVSGNCTHILKRMLTVDRNSRANMDELLEHPFVSHGDVQVVLPDLDMSQVPEFVQTENPPNE